MSENLSRCESSSPASARPESVGPKSASPASANPASANSETSSPTYAGHHPESGILTRLRDWTDVAPPLLLARTLRLAGSPIMVGCVWGLWIATSTAIDGIGNHRHVSIATLSVIAIVSLFWVIASMVVIRQGSLLTAGRSMESFGKILVRIGNRWLAILIVIGLLPVAIGAASLVVAPALWIAGLFSNSAIGGLVQILATGFISIAIFPAAILLAGGMVAIPMALAAVVNEPEPDPLDSLSRGYEYAMRGWLPGIGYVAVAAIFTAAIYPAAFAISQSGCWIIEVIVGVVGKSPASRMAIDALAKFPTAMMMVVAIGCTGGVYLLLRRTTGGKEVEDLWVDPREPEYPLPELKLD